MPRKSVTAIIGLIPKDKEVKKKAVRFARIMKIVALEKRGLFVEVIKKYLEDNILVFDGAMGTMLQKKGLSKYENYLI